MKITICVLNIAKGIKRREGNESKVRKHVAKGGSEIAKGVTSGGKRVVGVVVW